MATLNQVEEVLSIAAYVATFGQPLTVPPNYSGDASAATEVIPIWLKNAFKRDSLPGHTTIETEMHTMKKAGDALEKDIGEAVAWIQNEEKQVIKDITNYIHHQLTAMTAGQTMPSRAGSACKDVITFVKTVVQFVKDLQGIITALMDIIRYLISIIQRLQAFLQGILNSIATLINQICNFHLPPLPSITNLFGGLHFDGFKFTKGMFRFQLNFNTAFAFGNCQLRNLGLNPFATILQNFQNAAPLSTNPSGYIGAPMTDHYGVYFIPPLGGVVLAASINVPTNVPVFTPSYNPFTDFTGSLPAPSTVVSRYSLPASQLAPQVLSLIGGPTLDENPIGVTNVGAISIYPATTIPWSQYVAPVRAFGQSKNTLDFLQKLTTWDPTKLNPGGDQTAPPWAVAWLWLLAMNRCRGTITDPANVAVTPASVNGGPASLAGKASGRGGAPWIPAYQAVFAAFVDASATGPCYHDLNDAIPWNAGTTAVSAATQYVSDYNAWVTGGKVGTAPDLANYAITPVAGAQDSGPTSLTFFTKLAALDPATRGQVLWMLSYLEASLLGYTRSTTWDRYAPGEAAAPEITHPLAVGFASGPTGLDLDYLQLAAPATESSTSILLNSYGQPQPPGAVTVYNADGQIVAQAPSPSSSSTTGLANYPSSILVPHHLIDRVQAVIGLASASILNDPTYLSTNLRNMYVYTAEATAVLINSYSQFWRDFAANWVALQALATDPAKAALAAMVFNYPEILASALNPRSGCALTSQGQGVPVNLQDPYTLLTRDFQGRTGNMAAGGFLYQYVDPNLAATGTLWTPGWPWLAPALLPEVLLPATSETVPSGPASVPVYGSPIYTPGTPTGWPVVDMPDGSTTLGPFDPVAFYARPDIIALPYTEQQALCQLNQAFDDVLNTGSQLLWDNQNSINACYASLGDAQTQLANFESMSTTPMQDANGNTIYMDANGTAMLNLSGMASTPYPSFTDFYSATTPPYVPVPPFMPIPTLTPPPDNTPVTQPPAVGSNPPPGVFDFSPTGINAIPPVASMYANPQALTGPSDLPPMQSPNTLYASPVPVAATPDLSTYRQQLLASVPAPILITAQDGNHSAQAGTSISFSVTASQSTPTTPLSYQWQIQQTVAGVTSFVDVAGATTPILDLIAVSSAMNQSIYQCVVSSAFGSPTTSAPVTLTVTS